MTDNPKIRMATYNGFLRNTWLPGRPEKEIRKALDGLVLVDVTTKEGRVWREQQTWGDDPDFDD